MNVLGKLRAAAVALCVLGLGSCGGGGDGGAGAGGGESAFHISFSTSSLKFDYLEGTAPPLQTVIATAEGAPPSDTLFVGARVEGEGITQPIDIEIDYETGTATAYVRPLINLPAGTYSGKLRLLACADELCTRHWAGSPHRVSYSIVVRPRLAVSPAAISLTAAETQTGAAQSVTVTLPNDVSAATTVVTYTSGAPGWLQVQNDGTSLTLTPSATNLVPGTYAASVALEVPDSSQNISLPVSLSVSNGLLTPATVVMTYNSDSSSTGSFVVSAAPGVAATNWTASSDSPWLVLDTASGAMGDSLQWKLDPARFSALQNKASHTATITVSAPGLTSQVTTFTVTKDVVEIEHIDMLALKAGASGDVLLYGSGFSSLSAFAGRVQVSGGLVPTEVTVLSDGMARLSLASVPAGAYSIWLSTAGGIATHANTLQVLAPQTFAAQTLSVSQGNKTPLVWDPVQQVAYSIDQAANAVQRLAWNGSGFAVTSRGLGEQLMSLGLDRDRMTLVVTTRTSKVVRLDPETLETVSSATVYGPREMSLHESSMFLPLAISGDNRLWLSDGAGYSYSSHFSYDLDTKIRQVHRPDDSFFGGPVAASSWDGRKTFVSAGFGLSSPSLGSWIDMLDGVAKPTALLPHAIRMVRTNRTGTHWYIGEDSRVWTPAYGGRILTALPNGWTRMDYGGTVLSADGQRAYTMSYTTGAFVSAGTELQPGKFRIYVSDTSSTASGATTAPIVGYIDVAESPSCRVYSECQVTYFSMTLSEDGQTLFLIGNRNFIVVPVPANLQAGAAAPTAAAAVAPSAVGTFLAPASAGKPLRAEMRRWSFPAAAGSR
jgi:hypothetical protein